MVEGSSARLATPPYVSYKTFTTFLESMGLSIPNRLDKSAFPTMSGGTYNQLMPALRYLKLVDPTDKPTESLLELVGRTEPARQEELRQVLTEAYPYILQDPEFDLESATPKQLSDRFREYGATGDTVRKCERFFLAAAQDAGIRLGHYLQRSAGSTERKAVSPKRPAKVRKGRGAAKHPSEEAGTAQTSVVVRELLAKLPNFDPTWPKETQESYLAFTEKVMLYAKQPEAEPLEETEETSDDE